MSGGHFEYRQYLMREIAEEIENLIRTNDQVDEWGHSRNYSPETLAKFQQAAQTVREAAEMVHRIDWLVSGDDGEDSFHERLEADLANLRNRSTEA